jgi:hypothetical protein
MRMMHLQANPAKRKNTTICLPCAAIVLVVALLGGAPNLAASEVSKRSFVGYATDMETGELMYTEVHHETLHSDGAVHLATVYRGPDGGTIAARNASFADNPVAPPYHFEDLRADYREGLNLDETGLVVYRQLSGQSDPDRKRLGPADNLVADAGFDRLVLREWDRLLSGENVRADFLVPSRLRTLRFVIDMEQKWSLDDEPVVSFKMTSTNPLIRWLMGPIRVTYHQQERFLMRYEGISNLKNADGEIMKVEINFPLDERIDRQPGSAPSTKVTRYGSP